VRHIAHVRADRRYAAYSRGLARAATAALQAARSPAGEVTILLSGDARMRRLFRRYLRADRTTDVLSFPAGAGPVDGYLGDVLISIPQARRQAGRAGHSLRSEVALLAVHGVLHLVGHDHQSAGPRRRMARLQASILQRLGVRLAGDPWTR
jgi:probable rRNA maturation factor